MWVRDGFGRGFLGKNAWMDGLAAWKWLRLSQTWFFLTLKIHQKSGNGPNTTKSLGWAGKGMGSHSHGTGLEGNNMGKGMENPLEMLHREFLDPVDQRKIPIFALDWDGSRSHGSAWVWKGIMWEEGWKTSGNAALGTPGSRGQERKSSLCSGLGWGWFCLPWKFAGPERIA